MIEAPTALYLVKVTGQQEEMNRTFEQVKPQIANKLYREKKTKEFDEWLKRLRADAGVTVDEKALEAVEIAAAPAPGGPGMPGMPGRWAGAWAVTAPWAAPGLPAPMARPNPPAAAPAPTPAQPPAR